MIKTLLAQVKQYKKASLLTPLYAALEVVMEVLIPFITAAIIDKGTDSSLNPALNIFYYLVAGTFLHKVTLLFFIWF